MAFNRLIAVLPCYSLEDITKDLRDPQIAEFHAAWTVLWHPWILANSSGIPEWKRSDGSSLDVEQALVLVPSAESSAVDAPVMERMIVQNCTIATATQSRATSLSNVFSAIEDHRSSDSETVSTNSLQSQEAFIELPLPLASPPLIDLHGQQRTSIKVDDFYALGLATLLVQALTRKIHYSSNLDVVLFGEQIRTASQAFLNRDPLECERWLQSCYDQLSQERDRYFSQSAHLIDLTLLAKTTLQGSLDRQLSSQHPQNVLASTAIVERLSQANPSALQELAQGIASGRISLAGGSANSDSSTLPGQVKAEARSEGDLQDDAPVDYARQAQSTLYRRLHDARQSYLRFGINPPEVFAQMEPGIPWDFPTVLTNLGYKAALLHAFTDANYPVPTQSKIAWESSDGKTIDTIASGFVDASLPRSVFSIISDLGKQFDYHQIPTLVFAHWPDRCCDAFRDIVIATRRTSALGQWSTFANYFESTGSPYSNQKFVASQFALPFQKSRSEFQRASTGQRSIQQKRFQVESTLNFAVVADSILRGKTAFSEEAIQMAIDVDQQGLTMRSPRDGQPADSTLPSLNVLKEKIGTAIAKSIPRSPKDSGASSGFLVLNPHSGPQRVYLSSMKQPLESTDPQRMYAIHSHSAGTDLVVDLPPMGVLQLAPSDKLSASSARSKNAIAHGPLIGSSSWLLANEFIECQIDPKSGYLRSLMVARKRGGKLSGMPAIAIDKPSLTAASQYAIPSKVSNQYLFNSPLRATIVSRGELVHEGKCYGTFSAEYTLWRGARHADISVSYKLDSGLAISEGDSLWNLAPVWRTAWPSPTTTISTWVHGAKTKAQAVKSDGHQFYAPDLIELDDAEHRLYLTSGGSPVHRRVDSLFLETLVPMLDSRTGSHSFRLGMDWPRPYQTFLESLEEPWLVADDLGTFQSGGSLWMVQVNQPNVRLACQKLLYDSNSKPNGMRLMIQETHGKSIKCKLSFYRDVLAASKVQFDGTVIESLEIDSGEVALPITANECSFIDVSFTT
jgi:alpha-mannosidase